MAKNVVPSQEFVEIKTIKEGVIVLKNGGLRKILAVDGINIALKSTEEQKIIASAFQSFLNAIDFSIEIVVHSREMDLASYIKHLEGKLSEEKNELLSSQLREYIMFLQSLSVNGNTMKKQFFVVVPYTPPQITQKGILNFLKLGNNKNKESIKLSFEDKKFQLEERVRVVKEGLSSIGLEVLELSTKEIVELFYNLYNPGLIERTNLEILKQASDYKE